MWTWRSKCVKRAGCHTCSSSVQQGARADCFDQLDLALFCACLTPTSISPLLLFSFEPLSHQQEDLDACKAAQIESEPGAGGSAEEAARRPALTPPHHTLMPDTDGSYINSRSKYMYHHSPCQAALTGCNKRQRVARECVAAACSQFAAAACKAGPK